MSKWLIKKLNFPKNALFEENKKKFIYHFLEHRNVGKLVTNGKSSTNKKVSQLLRDFYFAKFVKILEEGLLFLAPTFSLTEYIKNY
jgi:hypothetical protein